MLIILDLFVVAVERPIKAAPVNFASPAISIHQTYVLERKTVQRQINSVPGSKHMDTRSLWCRFRDLFI